MIDAEKIKDLLQAHETIAKMSHDLKELKCARRSLEADLSKTLSEIGIEVVDTPIYRIYRYDSRLIPYKKKTTWWNQLEPTHPVLLPNYRKNNTWTEYH